MDKNAANNNNDKWVRCQSKSHPNQYYMFNSSTGETRWCTESTNQAQRNISVSLSKSKTPAQDRLKRLQNQLQKTKPKEINNKLKKQLDLTNQQHNLKANKDSSKTEIPNDSTSISPSISNNGQTFECSIQHSTTPENTKEAGKKDEVEKNEKVDLSKSLVIQRQNTSNKTEVQVPTIADDKQKKINDKPQLCVPVKPPNQPENTAKKKSKKRKPKSKNLTATSTILPIKNDTSLANQPQNTAKKKSEKNNLTATSTILPIKNDASLANQPENTTKKKSKKRKRKNNLTATSTILPIKNDASLAISKKIPGSSCEQKPQLFDSNPLPSSEQQMLVDCDIKSNAAGEAKPSVMSAIKGYCSSIFNKFKAPEKKNNAEGSTKSSSLSNYSRTSFKSKKPSPQQEKQNQSQIRLTAFSAKSALSSPMSIGNANDRLHRLRQSLQEQQSSLNYTTPILSPSDSFLSSSFNSNHSNVSTSAQEDESMDWSPIDEDTPSENMTNSSFLSTVTVSPSNVSTSSEHFDIINENLLRLAAEKKQKPNQWRKDYFYFIVDTNVFLENITFVDELTAMKLSGTKGTVIYVPFCVLQELDKLKIRSPSESIKLRAARAIKFLNKALEIRTENVQAQSSSEENRHLIKVKSPDDSILNCCLQVRENIDNLLLLTEDINLRNKAISSDILVSTKSDLISKHESLI